MQYRLVFDASTKMFEWWFAALVFLAGCAVWFFGWRNTHLREIVDRKEWAKGVCVRAMSIALWGGAVFTGLLMYGNYKFVQDSLRRGDVNVAQGAVNQFRRTPRGAEEFSVGNVPFYVSRYEATPGFNDTSFPIREGLPVRIEWVRKDDDPTTNIIVKLEVAEFTPPAGSH